MQGKQQGWRHKKRQGVRRGEQEWVGHALGRARGCWKQRTINICLFPVLTAASSNPRSLGQWVFHEAQAEGTEKRRFRPFELGLVQMVFSKCSHLEESCFNGANVGSQAKVSRFKSGGLETCWLKVDE